MRKLSHVFLFNLDPYIFQGYTFPDNKLSGELIRVNIYAPVGSPNSKYTLRLNDYGMLFLLNKFLLEIPFSAS